MRLPNREYIDRVLKQSYSQHENEVHILRYSTRPSNLYGETIGKAYGTPIKLKGYLEMDPTELRLQDLGWSKDTAEILVRFPFTILLESGLGNTDGTLNFTTDDKIHIPNINKDFQMSKHQSREPFIAGIPTFVWVGGRKFTHGR